MISREIVMRSRNSGVQKEFLCPCLHLIPTISLKPNPYASEKGSTYEVLEKLEEKELSDQSKARWRSLGNLKTHGNNLLGFKINQEGG